MDESKRSFIRQAVGLLAASGLVSGRAKPVEAADPPEVPPWMKTPGAGMGPYGTPAKYEGKVTRTLIRSQPGTTGAGASRTPLEALEGTITPSGLHFERHHSGVPDIDPGMKTRGSGSTGVGMPWSSVRSIGIWATLALGASRMRWLARAFVACGVLAPVGACAADIRIAMRAAAYAPAEIRGREGDTLTFVNHDAVPHQPFVPTTGWGVNVGDVKPGGTAGFPLPRPGQFEVECAYHPGMRAIVVVDR